MGQQPNRGKPDENPAGDEDSENEPKRYEGSRRNQSRQNRFLLASHVPAQGFRPEDGLISLVHDCVAPRSLAIRGGSSMSTEGTRFGSASRSSP